MIIQISAALVTLSFVTLVVYIIILINRLCQTLNQADQIIDEARKLLEDIGGPAKKAVEHANQASFDLKRKMEALSSIFNAASNVGDVWENKTLGWKKRVLSSTSKEQKTSSTASASSEQELAARGEGGCADLWDLVGSGIRLWQKAKK